MKRRVVVASTIYGEARSEGYTGMLGVAWVIRNRVKDDRWPNDAAMVCLQPKQFSCWNQNDNNLRSMLLDENSLYNAALELSSYIYEDILPNDITDGANHYHDDSVRPYWTKKPRTIEPTVKIGRLWFYTL